MTGAPEPGSADYLREVSRLLWPAPAGPVEALGWRRARASDSGLVVLPSARRPKLIVPAGRRAGAAAVRRYGEPGSVRARLATRALGVMLASGLGPVLGDRLVVRDPGGGSAGGGGAGGGSGSAGRGGGAGAGGAGSDSSAETVESVLSGLLDRPVRISMHLGAPRANRKPVLQLLTSAGETVGFAKIGVNPLTIDLIRAERAALTRLQAVQLDGMRHPRVLADSSWNGLDILILSPLPVWERRRRLTARELTTAMAELARAVGVSSAALAASEYWGQLTDRLDRLRVQGRPAATSAAREQFPPGLTAPGENGTSRESGGLDEHGLLPELIARLGEVAGAERLTFGCWHGDLTPWNLASTQSGLLVWDWERFSVGVPVGFDALHYWLQSRVVHSRTDAAAVAVECVAAAPSLLAPFDVKPRAARLTALAYLADLSVRYLADRQAEAGARLGDPRTWLMPAMESGLRGLTGADAEAGPRHGARPASGEVRPAEMR
jgi:hypothetical protein